MFLSKLKLCIAGIAVLAMLGSGTASLCHTTFATAAPAQDPLSPAKQIRQADPVKLQKEIERLRAELASAREQLKLAQQDIALLQDQAALALAKADRERRRAQAEADRARAAQRAAENVKPVQPLPAQAAVAVNSPDGRILVMGQGATIIGVDIQTGKVLFKSMGHKAPVRALAFSPDGKRLVSGGQDRQVIAWDMQSGKQTRTLSVPGPVLTIRFSDDGRSILIYESDQTVREVDAATGKELRVTREKLQTK